MKKFEIIILQIVKDFLQKTDKKARGKIIYNMHKVQKTNDPKLLKKITTDIWEFRTKYQNKQYRILAFWDKKDNKNTLVICSNGFVKKTQKTPKSEIIKAEKIMNNYLKNI